MDALFAVDDQDVLRGWIGCRRRRVIDAPPKDSPGVRFAFYGRTSTVQFQDPTTSRAWQREMAESVIDGNGSIVAEFFDAGTSRRVPWDRRSAAAELLRQAQRVKRGFDAVVVGEFERAFAGHQFEHVVAVLAEAGIAVWLPETAGPVNLDDPDHRALVRVLGAQSQREVLRARHRVLAAMTAQTLEQGRYLGGRPPYGYRLVDAGPHPNQAHAGWGRRLRRLDPDPVTAPQVRWMFARRLAGTSVAGIARELNERGVPCPSGADRERNQHCRGEVWNLRSVAVILANPRYTGRQVWRRQAGVPDAPGRVTAVGEWVVSKRPAHPALVSEADFVAVQQVRARRAAKDGSPRRYLLSGVVECGICGRRMDAHWVHGRAGYRCRHGHSSARGTTGPERLRSLYVREDVLITELVAAGVGAPSSPEGVARELRSARTVIVHDRTGWVIAER